MIQGLITQLKASVANENLPVFNSLKLIYNGGAFPALNYGAVNFRTDSEGVKLQVLSGTVYSDTACTVPISNETDIPANPYGISVYNKVGVPATIRIIGKDQLTVLGAASNANWTVPFNDLKFLCGTRTLVLTGIFTSGSVEGLVESYSINNVNDEIEINLNYRTAGTQVTFHGVDTNSVYYSVRDTNTNIVSVYGTRSGGVYSNLLATYNMSTKEWTYTS